MGEGGVYAQYSKGKVFLTDVGGVRYWRDRIDEHMEYAGRKTGRLVVLRIPKASVGDLAVDDVGSRDQTYGQSYFATARVKAAPPQAEVAPAAAKPAPAAAEPAAEAAPAQPKGKQPWEMSKNEFVADTGEWRKMNDEMAALQEKEMNLRLKPSEKTSTPPTKRKLTKAQIEEYNNLRRRIGELDKRRSEVMKVVDDRTLEHYRIVAKALSEGKPVPPEVLKDYPDLKAKEYTKTRAAESFKETEAKFAEEAASTETIPEREARRKAETEQIEPWVAERWDSAKLGQRAVWANSWVTAAGKMTKLGERIVESKWKALSPAAQRIVARRIQIDYPRGTIASQAAAEQAKAKPAPAAEAKPAAEQAKAEAEKPAWGAENKVVSREEYEKARADARKLGIVPQDQLAPWLKMGVFHFEAGARTFVDWSTKMVADVGEKIKPHLRIIWRVMFNAKTGPLRQQPASVIREFIAEQKRAQKGKPVTIRPGTLLKHLLASEEKVANKAYELGEQWGKLELTATHQGLQDFIDRNLPRGEQALVLRALAKQRTRGEMRQIIKAVNATVEKHAHRQAVQEFKKAMKGIDRKRLPDGFAERFDALVDNIATSQPRDATMIRANMIKWRKELGLLGDVPQAVIDKATKVLDNLDKVPFSKMTAEQIQDVTRCLLQLAAEIAHAQAVHFRGQLIEIADSKEAILKDVEAYPGKKFADTPREHEGWWKRAAYSVQRNLDTIACLLFGDGSVGHRIFVGNMFDAESERARITNNAREFANQTCDALGLTHEEKLTWSKSYGGKKAEVLSIDLPTAVDEDGKPVRSVKMTRAGLAEALAFLRDPRNRADVLPKVTAAELAGQVEKLTGPPTHSPIRLKDSKTAIYLDVADVKAIEAAADKIDPRIRQLANAYADYVGETLGDEADKTWYERNFWHMVRRPFYWPGVRDPEYIEGDPNNVRGAFAAGHLQDIGILKRKTGGKASFIWGGDILDMLPRHAQSVANYAATAIPIDLALKLLRDIDIRKAVRAAVKYGDSVLRDLETALINAEGIEPQLDPSGLERGVRWFLQQAHRGVLPFKAYILLYQPVSYLGAWAEIKGKYLLGALGAINKGTRAEMVKWSELMKQRGTGSGHAIMTSEDQGDPGTQAYYGAKTNIAEWGVGRILWVDMKVMDRLWEAVKAKGRDLGLKGDALMKWVAREHARIVARTQPNWGSISRTMLQLFAKKHPLGQLIPGLFCGTQRAQYMNMVIRAINKFRRIPRANRTKADYATLAKDLLVPTVVSATLIHFIRFGTKRGIEAAMTALAGVFGGHPPEKDRDKKLAYHGFEILQNISSTWMIFGDSLSIAARTVAKFATRVATDDELKLYMRPKETIAGHAIKGLYEAVDKITTAVADAIEGSTFETGWREGRKKWPTSAVKAISSAADPLSLFFGQPFQAVNLFFRPFVESLMTEPQKLRQQRNIWQLTAGPPKRTVKNYEQRLKQYEKRRKVLLEKLEGLSGAELHALLRAEARKRKVGIEGFGNHNVVLQRLVAAGKLGRKE